MAGWFDKKERGEGAAKNRFKLQRGYKYVLRIMGEHVRYRLHQSEWEVKPGWSDVCAAKEHGACPRCAAGNLAKERFCFPILVLQEKPPSGEWAVSNRPTIWAMTKKRMDRIFDLADDYEGREEELLGKGGAWKIDVVVTCPDDEEGAQKQDFGIRATGKKSLLTQAALDAYKAAKPDMTSFTKARTPDEIRKSMNAGSFDPDSSDLGGGGAEPEAELEPDEKPAKAGKKGREAPKVDEEEAAAGGEDAELNEMLAGLDDL